MYKGIQIAHKGFFISISILAAILIAVYGEYAFAADKTTISDKSLKSEEELIEEARAAIDKYLKEEGSEKPAPKVKSHPKTKEEPISKKETYAVAEEELPAKEKSANLEEKLPQSEEKPALQENLEPPTVNKEEVAADVATTNVAENSGTASDQQSIGEDIEFVSGAEKPVMVKPLIEPILKKMDIDRIGASPYYETYEGLRLLKYFTVGQRVEIYQEPRPVDSYILDAFSMNKLYGYDWYHDVNYRSQITPIFTRAYGTEITMSDPKNKEGQIRYTHDYREIYRNYYPKYPQIKWENWDQNEVLFMHSKQIEPIGWNYTSNMGYRYSTIIAKGDNNAYEVRHTYFGSLSLAPTDKLEWFGQAEYYKSMHLKTSYDYRPDHFLGRTELRIKSDDMKTSFIPSISYSKDYYYPFANTYQKYEIQYRVGRDFTKRFSASSTFKYVMGLRDEPDNTAPSYATKNPYKDKAYAVSFENRFSYNVYDRLYLQAGLDLSNGLNFAAFDNYGLLAGLEYYAPGMIRIDFGWRGNHYYNINDFLSTLYFKFYLFM